jgi:hypothetical protein
MKKPVVQMVWDKFYNPKTGIYQWKVTQVRRVYNECKDTKV